MDVGLRLISLLIAWNLSVKPLKTLVNMFAVVVNCTHLDRRPLSDALLNISQEYKLF